MAIAIRLSEILYQMERMIMRDPKNLQPLVSVVMATFNCVETVRRAVESVARQTYPRTELVVIDGNSSDGTLAELQSLAACIDKFVSEPDKGIYDAWNKGVKLASGDWICFIGADDVLNDDAIGEYINFIRDSGEEFIYVSSQVKLVNDAAVARIVGGAWHWSLFRKFMNVAHVGSFHHRKLFHEYGLFDDRFKICGDYEILLRPRSQLAAGYFQKITVVMAAGGVSQSNSDLFSETYRAKISSGGRNKLLATWERCVAQLKWYMRVHVTKLFGLRGAR
ncbi:glycosyltransferase [Paraburkholderia sp. 1N]|uniref:Glycosyltransferase n=1 Tax=Paraburkholderia solitsugae TaxID=2675748 RepID=A0ABX2BK82_9BURK|nr:glycosyltransferase family 2 protein [Paraburkholderia solitsugae]NPT40346.1 glycosyltransferase [Paraburkholderia solitsugae]